MKNIVLVKNMSELGAGTRGASLGFSALEMASHKFGKHLFNRFESIDIETHNDELYEVVDTPFAKHVHGILKSIKGAGDSISDLLQSKKFPFIISGDHSNAASTIYGIKKAFPDKRLGVVWVDAHGDLHSPYTSPSGNMHGMPLAISMGEDNIDRQKNDLDALTKEKWEALKNLGNVNPKINAEDLVFFGVRDTEGPEDYLMKKKAIRNFRVEEVRFKGLDNCLKEAHELLKDCDLIYISFDVDAMDCNLVSHGTGTPVELGFTPEEAQRILEGFVQDERLICFETVEINPLLDEKCNLMAETTVRILDNLIRKMEKA